MPVTMQQIGEAFSGGDFTAAFAHFADYVEWEIMGRETITGRDAVIAYCEKMAEEIGLTVLTNTNTIADKTSVAVQGFCIYNRKNEKTTTLSYCDIYSFREQKLVKISSYCVEDLDADPVP